MRIAIVDDNPKMFGLLKEYFCEFLGDNACLTYFPSGEAFLAEWEPNRFDLITIDIFMGELNGMEVARKIRENDKTVRIAFSTTSNEYASESYEVNACYYLHKPFGKEQIKSLLDRIDMAELERTRTVTLPGGKSVLLRRIIYADFASHLTTVHCKGGDNIPVRASFSETEKLLCAYPYFLSPTKGVTINLFEVSEQRKDTFVMSDGSIVPISRRKSKDVFEAYSSFLFVQLRNGDER